MIVTVQLEVSAADCAITALQIRVINIQQFNIAPITLNFEEIVIVMIIMCPIFTCTYIIVVGFVNIDTPFLPIINFYQNLPGENRIKASLFF